MHGDGYRNAGAGRIVAIAGGHSAFVPASPPPVIHYDPSLVLRLSRADAALGRLAAIGEVLPRPDLAGMLAGPFAHREAVLSSRIEGTRADLSDVLMDELGEAPRDAPADVREVRNYLNALDLGVRHIAAGQPLGLPLVADLHRALTDGLPRASPGRFRESQVWIGAPGSTLATAAYIPPPPQEMRLCLNDWETFVQVRDELPDLIQCALMHEHFESIHPFADGNGRVGRLLITLFLIDRKRLARPLLYLSRFIEHHRGDYYDVLMTARRDGDWAPWLRFFLAGVKETAEAAVAQGERLMEVREEYRYWLHGKRTARDLIDLLFENPYITVARVESALGVSPATARSLVANFEERRLLQRIPESRWGKLYVAPEILRAMGDPE